MSDVAAVIILITVGWFFYDPHGLGEAMRESIGLFRAGLEGGLVESR